MSDINGVDTPYFPPSIGQLVHSKSEELSKSHRRIAERIIEDPMGCAFMTLSDLSRETEAGEATVIRFCRILGFDGFTGLRQALQRQVTDRLSPTGKMRRSVDRIRADQRRAQSLLEIDQAMVFRARGHLSEADVERAAGLIAAARQTYLLGIGIARAVVDFLELRLLRMRYPVSAINEGGDQVVNKLLGATPKDVLVAVGFVRPRKELLAGLEIGRRKGLPIVAITNSSAGAVTEKADLVLEANRGPAEVMTSLAAPMALANVLAMELATRNRDRSLDALAELDALKREFDL